jgi:hypothetical protein
MPEHHTGRVLLLMKEIESIAECTEEPKTKKGPTVSGGAFVGRLFSGLLQDDLHGSPGASRRGGRRERV